MMGASLRDRATHEPSPKGLGHAVGIPSADAFDHVTFDLLRDSKIISVAGRRLIARNADEIREARDNLSDALAKLEELQCL